MFDIPERFKTNLEIKLNDFIPKDLNPNDKKRVKSAIRSVRMTYQITGEEIPSLIDDEHRCQVIQFYEIELENIKDANHIASIYQGLIKPLCVIRFYDSKEEAFSFADKRLSQTEEDQIVVVDTYITQRYLYGLPGEGIGQYLKYLSFDKVKNKTDKLSFYREWMYKIYLIEHRAAFAETDGILNNNAWYSSTRASDIYQKYVELVKAREMISRVSLNSERIMANKMVRSAMESLNRLV